MDHMRPGRVAEKDRIMSEEIKATVPDMIAVLNSIPRNTDMTSEQLMRFIASALIQIIIRMEEEQ